MKSMPDILRNLSGGPYSCSERSTGLEQEVRPPEDVPKVGQTLPLHSLRSQRSASRDHVGRRGSFRFHHCPPHLRWIAVATTVRSHLAIPTPIPFSGPQPSPPAQVVVAAAVEVAAAEVVVAKAIIATTMTVVVAATVAIVVAVAPV
jgi:hypothetical protein